MYVVCSCVPAVRDLVHAIASGTDAFNDRALRVPPLTLVRSAWFVGLHAALVRYHKNHPCASATQSGKATCKSPGTRVPLRHARHPAGPKDPLPGPYPGRSLQAGRGSVAPCASNGWNEKTPMQWMHQGLSCKRSEDRRMHDQLREALCAADRAVLVVASRRSFASCNADFALLAVSSAFPLRSPMSS